MAHRRHGFHSSFHSTPAGRMSGRVLPLHAHIGRVRLLRTNHDPNRQGSTMIGLQAHAYHVPAPAIALDCSLPRSTSMRLRYAKSPREAPA